MRPDTRCAAGGKPRYAAMTPCPAFCLPEQGRSRLAQSRLLIFPDGSGLAQSIRPADASGLTNALIAASGPLGPAIAGSLLIIASRTDKATRVALAIVSLALIVSTVIWVRTLTGWLVLPALGIAILALAWRGTADQRQFGIQLLGVRPVSACGSNSDICSAPEEASAASCIDPIQAPSPTPCCFPIGSGVQRSAR